MLLTEPTGNVAPRIAGERYEGGKLVDVPMASTAALDCATQGFPVPFTRYISTNRQKIPFFSSRLHFRGHKQDRAAIIGEKIRGVGSRSGF